MSAVIEAELAELKKVCENSVPGSKLLTCVPAHIRVELKKTDFKCLAVLMTYPVNYPDHHILVELKSRTLSGKLLDRLVKVTEDEAKKFLGRPHVLPVIKFVDKFISENPLCCCADEISECKKMLDLDSESATDRFKLSQKTSSISIKVSKNNYFFKARVVVPEEYPKEQVRFEDVNCNFPRVFRVWFQEQAKEIARRCVQPPIKPKPRDPPFEPKPSLGPTMRFLIEHVKRYPDEKCGVCEYRCFPEDPKDAIHNENAAAHVERVYCSHCYHHDCLILYMKSPPFKDVKPCKFCGQKIYHEKWKVTPQLAEARWAHAQAKKRELGEVVDFFGDLAIKPEDESGQKSGIKKS